MSAFPESDRESFKTFLPNYVRSQAIEECGGCGKGVTGVDIAIKRQAGRYKLETIVPGYTCTEKGGSSDLMCGGVYFALGTHEAISRSIARLMRGRGEHLIARIFRNARTKIKPQQQENTGYAARAS